MNRIDEIKQEITEERLRKGWLFEINNAKEVSKGNTEDEKKIRIEKVNSEMFRLEFTNRRSEKERMILGFTTKSYIDLVLYILEKIRDNPELELHEMKRKY